MNRFQRCQRTSNWAVIEFLIYESENSHRNSPAINGSLWWRYCEHKSCVLEVKNQERVEKLGPERPAVVWKACHHNTWFEQAKIQYKYSRKLMNYSERHSRIVKHWFIIAVLGYTIPQTSAATAWGDRGLWIWSISTLLLQTISYFTPSDFWLLAALKKHPNEYLNW